MTIGFTRKKVIAEVGSPYLNLYKGAGYWYFEYDREIDGVLVFETHSVYTMRLGDLALAVWVGEGKDFVDRVEQDR